MSILVVCPSPTAKIAVIAKSTARPQHEPMTTWRVALPRVVWPASNNSHRPASSSPRRSFVASNSPQIAPRTLKMPMHFHSVKPPTFWSSFAGPNKTLVPALDPKVAATRATDRGRVSGDVRVLLERDVDPEDHAPQCS